MLLRPQRGPAVWPSEGGAQPVFPVPLLQAGRQDPRAGCTDEQDTLSQPALDGGLTWP